MENNHTVTEYLAPSGQAEKERLCRNIDGISDTLAIEVCPPDIDNNEASVLIPFRFFNHLLQDIVRDLGRRRLRFWKDVIPRSLTYRSLRLVRHTYPIESCSNEREEQ